jgi:hypothetical protein
MKTYQLNEQDSYLGGMNTLRGSPYRVSSKPEYRIHGICTNVFKQ